jgi:ABC-type branched-subunit amino acid transport system ATPase component
MELVMAVSDQIAVLNFGQKIAQGTPAQIQSDTLVKKAYLGGDEQ